MWIGFAPRVQIKAERKLSEYRILTEKELIILVMDWRHFQENHCLDFDNILSFPRLQHDK
jgi:hypothetical protein